MTPRRITAGLLDQTDADLLLDGHLYFRKLPSAPNDVSGRDRRSRALFVFLCPAEGPGPEDVRYLRTLVQGHGIGHIAVLYLFTSSTAPEGLNAADVGPLADSAMRAALRWLEAPGVLRLQSGKLVLCYGERWKRGSIRGQAMDDRVDALSAAMATFKRRAFVPGGWLAERPINPLTAKPRPNPGLGFVHALPNGQPYAAHGVLAWWCHGYRGQG